MTPMVSQKFRCKTGVGIKQFMFIHPSLLMLFSAFSDYSSNANTPVVITSIFEDVFGRVSKGHSEGRMMDLSAHGWTIEEINAVVGVLNEMFEGIGAISYSDGKSRAVVYHDAGSGYHFHLQVRP